MPVAADLPARGCRHGDAFLAEHPRRNMWVGASDRLHDPRQPGRAVVPRLVPRQDRRQGPALRQGRPALRLATSSSPRDDDADRGAHGMFDDKAHAHDPWSWASMNRSPLAAGPRSAAAAAAAALWRRRTVTDRDTPRVDGFAPIEDYACARRRPDRRAGRRRRADRLVAGADAWTPRRCSRRCSTRTRRLLELAPTSAYTVDAPLLGDSNVLETTFRTDTGIVPRDRCPHLGAAGPLPWGELVRRVEGVDGKVAMRWACARAPGSARPALDAAARRATIVLHFGDQHLALRCLRHRRAATSAGDQVAGRSPQRRAASGCSR